MIIFKTLDVAIGVTFLYLVLAFLSSAVVEFISNWRNWRAQMLHDAIANMLDGSSLMTVDEIYTNPIVLAFCRNDAAPSWIDLLEQFGWHKNLFGKQATLPSYIPANAFSAAVMDELKRVAPRLSGTTSVASGKEDLLTALKSGIMRAREAAAVRAVALAKGGLPTKGDGLQAMLEAGLATGDATVETVQAKLEIWFNDTMDRVSGWYKRRTQYCLLLIGFAICFAGNIDTIAITRWLWNGDAARNAIVNAATEYEKAALGQPRSSPATQSEAASSQPAPPANAEAPLTEIVTKVVDVDRQLTALQYPVGWPAVVTSGFWFIQYFVGAVISAIAISMGSPFWFDTLQGLFKIRGTGPKPQS